MLALNFNRRTNIAMEHKHCCAMCGKKDNNNNKIKNIIEQNDGRK